MRKLALSIVPAALSLLPLTAAMSQTEFGFDGVKQSKHRGPADRRAITALHRFDPLTELTEATTGSWGTLTKSSDIVTTYDGQLIQDLDVSGRITVQNKNVTIRNCRISNSEYYGIIAADDLGYDVSGLVVEYSTISGAVNGIAGKGIFRRNNIFRVDNGVNVWGPSEISENYIHDLGSVMSGFGGHNDGIENNGSPMTLRRNRIEASRLYDTSAVMTNNEFGALSNILIEGNFLSGGQYTIYVDDSKNPANSVDNFVVIDNIISRGNYGYGALYTSGVIIGPTNSVDEP